MRAIEIALREIIVEQLSAVFGARWHKTQVPEDVRLKFGDAITVERRYPWLQLVPHHPIYYTDFPDLKKIITRNDNWTKAFAPVFGRSKDVILNMFTELEPLRNSIAHSRAISPVSVDIVETARERLRTALGADRFDVAVARTTLALDVYEILRALRQEGEVVSGRIRQCDPRVTLQVWLKAKDQWWFEETYIGADLAPIRAFFALAQDYCALPRSMVDGYRIERWLVERQFEQLAGSLRSSWQALKTPDNQNQEPLASGRS
jgi:hypothetical protein